MRLDKPRIAPLADDEMDADQKEITAPMGGRVLNIFRTLIRAPKAARGFLAGNRNSQSRGETIRAKTDDFAQKLYYRQSDFTVVDRLTEIAEKRGVQNSQVALAWILSKPGISSPIIGASKMAHLDQALAAMEIRLDDSEIKALEEPYEPHPVLGF